MPSRREFLTAVATALAASRVMPAFADSPQAALASPLNGPIGLQLWSLQHSAFRALRFRMRLPVSLEHPSSVDMGVTLRGTQPGVAK